jgi:transposase-like protein
MNMLEFQAKYGTEEQCRQYLFETRWPEGFSCPRCNHGECFNVASRGLYQCKACRYQASVTAGTIFDKTRTPLVKWFLAIYLSADDKRGISALALKSKIGVAYFTAWTMLQKIRHAMGEREGNHYLSGIVEMDEAFFGAPSVGGKRGRGTDKTPVLVSVSLSPEEKPRMARMKVADAVDGAAVEDFLCDHVIKGSEIRTDGLNIYNGVSGIGYTHTRKIYDAKNQPEHLHWLHIIVSNVKSFIDGTYHGLDIKHLQRYLDEFCYRFNRRWAENGLFSRLLFACAIAPKITYAEVIG